MKRATLFLVIAAFSVLLYLLLRRTPTSSTAEQSGRRMPTIVANARLPMPPPAEKPKPVATSKTAPAQAPGALGIVEPDGKQLDLSPGDLQAIAAISEVYRTPIEFWGRVDDERGQPVGGAEVTYTVSDKYFKDGTKRSLLAQANGEFHIANLRGASLFVRVAKTGYYEIGTDAARSFGYGVPKGDSPPTEESPAVFRLRKRGPAEALLVSRGHVRLPRDGTVVGVSLRAETSENAPQVGRSPLVSPSETADLLIEASVEDAATPPGGRFDWRCRVSVRSPGGLVERTDEFAFEAPVEGYVKERSMNMASSDPRWSSTWTQEFFVKLADGCFGRVRLQLAAGGEHFVFLESYVNPLPGHRNLEFDETKSVPGAVTEERK